MPVEVIMPKVDMDMATGRIAVWHVDEGGRVDKAAPLFEIETDKAAMEVEAPASGTLRHRSPAGAEVPIGQPVGWIYADGEAPGPVPGATADAAPEPPPEAMPLGAEPGSPDATTVLARPVDPSTATPRATPLARKLARDHGVSLETVTGSALRGRIQAADLRRAIDARHAPSPPAPHPPIAPPPGTRQADQPAPLSVLRSGSGERTPFVLLHGFAADASAWAPLEPLLPPGHPVLRIELPCHGRSPIRTIASFASLAGELRACFDALDLDRVHLVGHSLGGALALAIADTRPRRIASLTLLCPAGLGPEIDASVLDGIVRATRAESVAPWLRALAADPDCITGSFVQAAMLRRAEPALRAAQADLASVLFPDGTQAFDLRPALQRIAVPTRIVWGRQDRILPWRHALAAPGRVSLNLFEGCGHLPQLERAEELAVLLRGLA